MKLAWVVIVTGLQATASAATPDDVVVLSVGCKHHNSFAGSCFTFHGRVGLYEGSPDMRIWPVGSKRLLGVLPSENEDVPDALRKLFLSIGDAAYIFGTFEACPLTSEQPGHMQYVCIRSANSMHIVSTVHHKP